MADAPLLEARLTSSSKVALDWASWFAADRSDTPPTGLAPTSKSSSASRPAADTLDLLLGILFAHPAESELRQLLDHFEIPLASLRAALPTDHEVNLSALPHGAPSRHADLSLGPLDPVLKLAGELAERSGADKGLARIADLFGALIQTPDQPAADLLDNLLEEHGARVDIDVLGNEYSTFLGGLPSVKYADFLAQAHPWTPRTALIAGYDADAVRPDTDTDDGDAEPRPPQDFVGIGPEVDAFAYLIAARALIPPLAIGLFGDWGSGKSFFMQALQRRVDRITEKARTSDTPQRDLPIRKYVVQIQFNAWHYVEGNLWASLVEHIFSNLRTSPKDQPGLLQKRRQRVTEKIASAQLARDQVEAEIRAERMRLAAAQKARQKLEADQLLERRDLEAKAKSVAEQLAQDLDHDVTVMLTRMGYPQVGASVTDFAQAIAETRTVLQRGNGIARRLQDGGIGWVLAILAVIALGPIVSWVLNELKVPNVTAVLASVAAVLGGATALLRQGTAWTSTQLGKLEKAEQKVLSAQTKLEEQKLDADRKLASIQAELHAKQEVEQALTSRLVDLQRELQAITPGRVLSDFIDARIGSDDYRKHLGLTALVRRDFEDLWRLIASEEQAFLKSDTGTTDGTDPPSEIGRIVLYIDDLDRCPPRVVVNVLQAIHLLLAFPLFVVVVAVDARWLSSSLQKQYGELLGRPRFAGTLEPVLVPGSTDDQATPDDYLEKIFQVPFWVRPLDSESRGRIVQGLVAPSLRDERVAAAGSAVDGHGPIKPEDPAIAELAGRLLNDEDKSKLHPQSLEITTGELAFMQTLSPLLGDSPRAVKRFVNVYRLMKSLAEGRDADFMSDTPHAGYKLVLFLLAVVTGMPEISADLFRSIKRPQPDQGTLAQFANAMAGTNPADAASLQAWFDNADDRTWGAVMLADLAPWSRKLARFSFRSEVA